MRGSGFAKMIETCIRQTGKKQQSRVLTIFSCDQQETNEKRVSVRMMIIDLGWCVGGWAAGGGGCAQGRAGGGGASTSGPNSRRQTIFCAQNYFMVAIQWPELNGIFRRSPSPSNLKLGARNLLI